MPQTIQAITTIILILIEEDSIVNIPAPKTAHLENKRLTINLLWTQARTVMATIVLKTIAIKWVEDQISKDRLEMLLADLLLIGKTLSKVKYYPINFIFIEENAIQVQ